jgi:hypothetical protein
VCQKPLDLKIAEPYIRRSIKIFSRTRPRASPPVAYILPFLWWGCGLLFNFYRRFNFWRLSLFLIRDLLNTGRFSIATNTAPFFIKKIKI